MYLCLQIYGSVSQVATCDAQSYDCLTVEIAGAMQVLVCGLADEFPSVCEASMASLKDTAAL